MSDWEDEDALDPEIEFTASAKGVILPLECLECGGYFKGYSDETICPVCKEGNSVLRQLLEKTETASAEAEEHYFEYRVIEYEKGWLKTHIELNVNTPAPTWQEELHAVMKKRGMLRRVEGKWKYRYPETLVDYMALLTMVASARLKPFHQMCIIVRFWRTEYKFVKLTIYENGVYKDIMHSGSWSKWMKLGKEEELVEFKPFHPVVFLYFATDNKGFRELIDVWKNTMEGGVDALIKLATDEVFG